MDHYDAPRHEPQLWNDESVIVFDSFERNSGCRYFAIIDYDEFFIPRKNRTLREMFVSVIFNLLKSIKITQEYISSAKTM